MDIEMIDDNFWLKYAKDHTEKATDLVNAGADKLDTFLTWAWGIYTAVFTVAIILNLVTDDYTTRIIMALPVIIIPIAKFLCISVQLPVFASYFPDMPDSIINDLYSKVINRKHKLFQWALAIATIGVLNIGVALFIFKIGLNDNYSIKVSQVVSNHLIFIKGKILNNKAANITLIGKFQDSLMKSIDLKVQSNKKGDIDTVINDNGLKPLNKVYCKWDKGNGKTTTIEN